jgi:hypothetical protein
MQNNMEKRSQTVSDVILITEDMSREIMGNVLSGLSAIRGSCDVHIRYDEFPQYLGNIRCTRGTFKVQGSYDFQVRMAMHLITQCISYYKYLYDQTRPLQKFISAESNQPKEHQISSLPTPQGKFRGLSKPSKRSYTMKTSEARSSTTKTPEARSSTMKRDQAYHNQVAQTPPISAEPTRTVISPENQMPKKRRLYVAEQRAEVFLEGIRQNLLEGEPISN